PRLARGGRPARRRAHPVAPEEELGMAPFVDRREPDRKIAEEMEPDRPRRHGEAAPVRVRQELREPEEGDRLRMARTDGAAPCRPRILVVVVGAPEPGVERVPRTDVACCV